MTSYLSDGVTLRSWLITKDHKRIAILFSIAITAFFFIGGLAATLIRVNRFASERTDPFALCECKRCIERPFACRLAYRAKGFRIDTGAP